MNQTKITRYDTEIMCSALNNGPHGQRSKRKDITRFHKRQPEEAGLRVGSPKGAVRRRSGCVVVASERRGFP
jgi:hypothetical protein